ncbi:MAG TPA: zinc ABC transporter substrate-binding protein [Woeseiaceae bacterium]|jgi:zinc/manganese transport system substrate-binding protein|nr:zinc ABC transporter substrate-binding protein [Woeseiaceae bacterium]
MRQIILALLLAIPVSATAEVRVFVCEPEWAALATELGGALVETYSATTALQDPHYIQARPSLIAKLRRADLLICSGAQLEIGWLPALLQKANNRKVMPGSDGYLEASRYVLRLGATANVDRAQGDIHPQGNPHIQTNPHNIVAVAREITRRLSKIDSINTVSYDKNLISFLDKWRAAIERWEAVAGPLSGRRMIAHHKSWVYLADWLGLEEVAYLEPIAGLPPTATHLSRLTNRFADGGADVIVRSPYQDDRPSEWLSERIQVPALVLPLSVGGTDDATDLFSLYDAIISRLLGAMHDV